MNTNTELDDPDTNTASRSVAPVSNVTVGEPDVVSTTTTPSNATRTDTTTPAFFAPSAVLLDTPDTTGATVSTVTEPDTDELTLPATSVCDAVNTHTPSANEPRSHDPPDVDPDIVHTTSDSPDFDAVTVTVPPASAATTRTDGVTSDVTPSDELDPKSDNNATPTDTGTPGAVSSTTTLPDDTADRLPASSTKNARYEPSTRPDNDIEVDVLAEVMATDVQRFAFAPVIFDTVLTVTVDFTRYTVPVSAADTVALAELLARTLVNVGAVATRSIVTVEATASEAGPLLPDTSSTPPAASFRFTVPSVHELTDTVIEVPVDADGVNTQPVAVPELLEKSDEMRPLTLSLNVSV